MAGRPTRQQYVQKMQAMKRERDRKADAKAASENRFASEQQRLREAFLARLNSPSVASLKS